MADPRAACVMHERNGGHHARCVHCQNADLRLALRRLCSTETFTTALDLRPRGSTRAAIVDELQARMLYAKQAVDRADQARRSA